ncbi:hypothetical protein [Streptomyces chartreusis]
MPARHTAEPHSPSLPSPSSSNNQLPYLAAINASAGALVIPDERLREVMGRAHGTPLVWCDASDRTSSRDALIALIQHLLNLTPEAAR